MACSFCGKPRNIIASIFGGQDHPACVNAHIEKLRVEEAARMAKEEAEVDALIEKRKAEEAVRKAKERAEADAQKRKALEDAARHQAMKEQIARGEFKSLNDQSEMLIDDGETLCMLIKGCWSTLFYARAAGRIMPGQAVRVDGIEKVDFGSLHITDRRVCFIGKGGGKTFRLKKLLQCETHGDTLHIVADGKGSSAYFIIEPPAALELAQAAILKLAERAKRNTAASSPMRRRKIVYIWRCRMDEDSCPECRERHKMEWKHKREANLPPHSGCSNVKGCRCELAKVYDDEPSLSGLTQPLSSQTRKFCTRSTESKPSPKPSGKAKRSRTNSSNLREA